MENIFVNLWVFINTHTGLWFSILLAGVCVFAWMLVKCPISGKAFMLRLFGSSWVIAFSASLTLLSLLPLTLTPWWVLLGQYLMIFVLAYVIWMMLLMARFMLAFAQIFLDLLNILFFGPKRNK